MNHDQYGDVKKMAVKLKTYAEIIVTPGGGAVVSFCFILDTVRRITDY